MFDHHRGVGSKRGEVGEIRMRALGLGDGHAFDIVRGPFIGMNAFVYRRWNSAKFNADLGQQFCPTRRLGGENYHLACISHRFS